MEQPYDRHAALLRMAEQTARQRAERRKELENLQKAADDYEELQQTLQSLPAKVEHKTLVPFGKMAFFPGTLRHTNEIMVLLGDNYFVERSADQAAAIAGRRAEFVRPKVAAAEEEVATLTARLNQIRAFGDMQRDEVQPGEFEIREQYCSDEEADEDGDEDDDEVDDDDDDSWRFQKPPEPPPAAPPDSDDDTDEEGDEPARPALPRLSPAGRRGSGPTASVLKKSWGPPQPTKMGAGGGTAVSFSGESKASSAHTAASSSSGDGGRHGGGGGGGGGGGCGRGRAAAAAATPGAAIAFSSDAIRERDPETPPSEVDIAMREVTFESVRRQQVRAAVNAPLVRERDLLPPQPPQAATADAEEKPISRFKANRMQGRR